jgi:type VI secretion system secreted protein VgrG
MAPVTQEPRHIAISTPLGDDVLLLRGFTAHEEISRLFTFDLDLLSEDYEINFDDIIGQNVTIRMEIAEGGTRYWNGYISRFVQGVSESHRFAQYRATMVPWLWFLTQTADCRIFQDMKVPDIVKQVFDDLGFSDVEDRLSGDYAEWKYCVQYRETDFDFVSRLMEQEGIYYYFLHEADKCSMVLCDSLSKHDPFETYDVIDFTGTHSSALPEKITDWVVEKAVRPGKFAHTDYNEEKPNTSLVGLAEDPKDHAEAEYEIYDYPGEYSEKDQGDTYANVRMQALARPHEICSGRTDSRGICSGYRFTLAKHWREDQNQEYLIVSTDYHATAEDYETSGGQDATCTCNFTTIPASVQFRPPRITPKPAIKGTQTAIVTGLSGEEIYTDELGRVKVQFHWDREGQFDENSSCWIRVGQNWAGKGWGGLHIPRIGMEVIVDFLEGNPDRPIIVGAVYHGENLPPYELPAEKTKSTLKSESSIGGGGFNEIRMEDKKGEEQLFFHAQKDQHIRVEGERREWVGKDRHLKVEKDKKEHVKNNREEKVGADHMEEIGKDRHLKVKGKEAKAVSGSHSFQVGGDVIEVFKKNHSEEVTQDYYLKGNNVVIEGMTNVTIKVGQSYLAMEASGIKIGSMGTIELEALGRVEVTGTSGVKIESPATAEIESTSTTVKGNAMLTLQGGLVKIN